MGSMVTGFPTLFFASQQLMVTAIEQGVLDSETQQAVQSVLKNQTDLVHITANMGPKEWQRFAAQSIAARLHPKRPSTFVHAGFDGLQILCGQGNGNSSDSGTMSPSKNPIVHFNRGLALQKGGQNEEAKKAYRMVFQVDSAVSFPQVHVSACLNLGVLFLDEDDFSAAAYILLHALEINPDHLEARNNYAAALLGLRQYRGAVEQWSKLLEKAGETERAFAEQGKKLEALPPRYRDGIEKLRQMVVQASASLRSVEERSLEKKRKNPPVRFDRGLLVKLSKKVSHALRHAPWEYALEVDREGWVSIDRLLSALRWQWQWEAVDRTVLEKMIDEVSEGRFEIQGDQIRALYGHSVHNQIERESAVPPKNLYHGTTRDKLASIFIDGLTPGRRQYVHLTVSGEGALEKTRRKKGNSVILRIDAEGMSRVGLLFYVGNKMVWLVDSVPPHFIQIVE